MTARDVYEGVLFELNKVHAPAVTVEEFVYFLNKAILAYSNERYNFYAVNQQLTDDLRVLLVEYNLTLTNSNLGTDPEGVRYVQGTLLDDNYLHILSCDLYVRNTISNLKKKYTAKRLTLDMHGAIYNNDYLKPALHRPYYLMLPAAGTGQQNNSIFKILTGDDVQKIVPHAVRIYYMKLPEVVTLTDDQVYNLVGDTSDILEFPDYLKNEFVKRVTWYQLESTRDQRASTFPQLNQEIQTIVNKYHNKHNNNNYQFNTLQTCLPLGIKRQS
jgi:hypothetical protein